MAEKNPLERKITELELELAETKSLAKARSSLLEANLRELNEVYGVLKDKLREIKIREEKLNRIEESLSKANKLAAMGELAGSIAHEIKNPLISIQGFAERIEKIQDRDKIERYARLINKESGRLSQVLVNLLDFARMNEPRKERFDVNEIVDDTVLFMEHHLTRFRNIEIVVKKAEDLPRLHVDKIQIQQTLVNIIINAAQAMPGGGTIRIATTRENGNVVLSVSDNGIGIGDEDLKKIFEPFFSTKARGQGTGLGLSLCKRFIEANGGRIEVDSRPGEGTSFRIVIPAAEPSLLEE